MNPVPQFCGTKVRVQKIIDWYPNIRFSVVKRPILTYDPLKISEKDEVL